MSTDSQGTNGSPSAVYLLRDAVLGRWIEQGPSLPVRRNDPDAVPSELLAWLRTRRPAPPPYPDRARVSEACDRCATRCSRGLILREHPRRWQWCPHAPTELRELERTRTVEGCRQVIEAIARSASSLPW